MDSSAVIRIMLAWSSYKFKIIALNFIDAT